MIVAHPDRLVLLEVDLRFQHLVPIDGRIESDHRREEIRMELFKTFRQFQETSRGFLIRLSVSVPQFFDLTSIGHFEIDHYRIAFGVVQLFDRGWADV